MTVRKLTLFRMAGYGSGAAGFNLFYSTLNLYLLYYYTDVIGLPPAIAGLIFMIAIIWDAVTDPLMGAIASRTRTRFGSFRPYILFGAPFVAISFVMMFAAPVLFPSKLILVTAASHVLFRTMFTMVAIPHASLIAVMTFDTQQRSKLAGSRTLFGIIGALVTAAVTLKLAKHLGDGDLTTGFLKVAITYAITATAILTTVFFITFESPLPFGERKRPNTQQTLQFLRANKPFWFLFLAILVASIGNSIATKTMVYYVSYNAGTPSAVSTILTIGLIGAALAVPLWSLAPKVLEKRTIWMIGTAGFVVTNALLLLFKPTDITALMAFRFIDGVFLSSILVSFWSMTPDTVEYGQWKSGIRDEGVLFGLNQFALKAASGIGIGLLGLVLEAIGYIANQVQSPETLNGIYVTAFLLPLICYTISFGIIIFYPITRSMHRSLFSDMNQEGRVHD